jgi:voltage-gated potassium channel Kch
VSLVKQLTTRRRARDGPPGRDIVLLGHFRITEAVLDLVEERAPRLKSRIMVADYHATRGRALRDRGFHWEYGDLAHPDGLAHLGIDRARIVVTTVSDTFLKGISARLLAIHLRRLAPQATIVMTGEEKGEAEELLRAGADHVLVPGEITSQRLLELLGAG